MKLLALLIVLSAAAAASGLTFLSELDDIWNKFKDTFAKSYETEAKEHSSRSIFEKRVKENTLHNLRADLDIESYTRGLNEFSDVSHPEFVQFHLGYNPPPRASANARSQPLTGAKLNSTVDWRKEGLVTPVKNQKDCGSCWTFSATGSLEGQQAKKTGNLVALSEQNLIDCAGSHGTYGCNGGHMTGAFQYVESNKGINTASSYPYEARDGYNCKFRRAHVGATCTGYVDIPSGDEGALQTALATVGPVSVGIDANHESLQSYKRGIYYERACNSFAVNHAVLAVGYGTEDGRDYWLVKNSWGTSWGMKGYMKLARNRNNHCGIASTACYPVI